MHNEAPAVEEQIGEISADDYAAEVSVPENTEEAPHQSAGPHISIKPETIGHLFDLPITNSYVTSLVVIVLFSGLALYYHSQQLTRKKGSFIYLMNAALSALYGFFKTLVGNRVDTFFSLFAGLFFYILLQNWFGLLPGVGSITIKVVEEGTIHWYPLLRGATADLNTTLALAIVSFVVTQYVGIKYLGFKNYISKFINFANPLNFVIGIFELISEFSRIISFSFRLFGNIFAGEVMLTIIAFLVPFVIPFPFLIMEIFVGFLQAFVFVMLTAVFINLAISHH